MWIFIIIFVTNSIYVDDFLDSQAFPVSLSLFNMPAFLATILLTFLSPPLILVLIQKSLGLIRILLITILFFFTWTLSSNPVPTHNLAALVGSSRLTSDYAFFSEWTQPDKPNHQSSSVCSLLDAHAPFLINTHLLLPKIFPALIHWYHSFRLSRFLSCWMFTYVFIYSIHPQ